MNIKLYVFLSVIGLLSFTSQVLAQADTVFACSNEMIAVNADVGFDRYRWYPTTELQSSTFQRAFYQGTTNTTLYVQQQNYISQNLVVNPGFEDGNVGFDSGYRFAANGSPSQGTFGIVMMGNQHNPGFDNCIDPIAPGEFIMAIDGAADETTSVWCQTVNVNPTSSYAVQLELASLSNGNPARLQIQINGENVGGEYAGDLQACIWERARTYWDAIGTTTAEICIYNLNTASSGNDFALDDISFFELGPVVLDSFYVSLGGQTTGQDEVKLCGSDRFTNFGLDLGIGDSGTATLVNAVGCDSLLTISAIQGDSLIISQLVDTLCLGDTLRYDSWVISSDTTLCKTMPAQSGCDTILCLEVRYFTPENILADVSPPSCSGDNNGQISLSNLAGSGTIQYTWTDGPTGPNRQDLPPDTYQYSATDARGCTISNSIELPAPIPLVIEDILTVGVRCPDEQNGFALVDVSGGTGPIEFIVERNGSTFNIDTLGIGTYNLTARDSFGCSVTDNFSIIGPGPVRVSLAGDTLVRLGNLANHQVSFSGDDATFTLTYNDQSIDSLIDMGSLDWSPPGDGLLVATVIDENGCEDSQSIFVRVQSRDTEFFPTAFSPNEDGINDRFGPAPDPAIVAFEEFIIADRWGNIIYRVKDCPIDRAGTCFWDGKREDKFLELGVYVFHASLLLADGTTIQQTGEVTLAATLGRR